MTIGEVRSHVATCCGEDGDEGSELLWRGVAADEADRHTDRLVPFVAL